MNYRHAALSSLMLTSLAAFAASRSGDAPVTTVTPVTVVASPLTNNAKTLTQPSTASSVAAPKSSTSLLASNLTLAATTVASPPSPCASTYAQANTAALPEITVKSGGINGWDERYKGRPLSLLNAAVDHCQTFDGTTSLVGPMLYAKGRESFGLASFDAAGGAAYKFYNGNLVLKAYKDAAGAHSGLIQSVSPGQAYNGVAIQPNQAGYTCAGCYWEARMKMPVAYGTWAGFWLLSPDDPKNRGHLEVDGIEYYSLGNKRGHHHATHRWSGGRSTGNNGYSLSDEIGNGDWHTYGIDLRGIAKIDGKPAIVIYMDGKEIDRLVTTADYFTTPFYYLVNLATATPKTGVVDYPQALWIDHVTAWKPRG
ncbi:family 16 glycosylhydrolase [Sphingomonas sp. LR60]|uniref:family 16 glycosylhydrolase n=1 Tax=Sphingomonas sp. LR60 TaxID=3050233 RepID=UPI002FDF948B